jgi:hypothetical protein
MRTILRRCREIRTIWNFPLPFEIASKLDMPANGMRHSFSSTVCGTPTRTCSRCLNRRVDLVGPRHRLRRCLALDDTRDDPERVEGSKGRCVEEMRAGEAETERLQQLV